MGIFSGLGKFGLGNFEDTKVIDNKTSITRQQIDQIAPKVEEKKEEDVLFDKHYVCPVCDLGFTSKCIKAGKLKVSGKDTDLRPLYDWVDPIKYDVISCDKCGYSSLTRFFGKLSTRQMKEIKEKIGDNFGGLNYSSDVYSYDDAIERYKLALLSTVVKNAKNSERAYTCLRMAWVIRGKRISVGSKSEEYKQLYFDELDCLKNAYDGFILAISNEPFPIAGMDENTLKYILADIARKLKKYDESVKLLGDVITSKTTNKRLKDEALKLKELIKDELKKNT